MGLLPTGNSAKNASILALIVQQVGLILIIRYSRTAVDTPYIPSMVVLSAECLKILLNLALEIYSGDSNAVTVFGQLMHKEALKLLIPAFLYLIQNNLLFVALTNLPVPIYQVTIQGKLLTTSLFSRILLDTRLSTYQYVSLFVLAAGMATVQLGAVGTENKSPTDGDATNQNYFMGFVAVAVSCLTSGFAGVYFEKVLKQKNNGPTSSVYVRNMQLALWSAGLGIFAMIISDDWKKIQSDAGAFQGYNWIVWTVVVFQALTGLLIALVIKYSDNIVKGYATSVALVMATMVSIIFGDMQTSPYFLLGAFLVILAVDTYTRNPPTSIMDIDLDEQKKSNYSGTVRYGVYLVILLFLSIGMAVSAPTTQGVEPIANHVRPTANHAEPTSAIANHAEPTSAIVTTPDLWDLYGQVPKEFQNVVAAWPKGVKFKRTYRIGWGVLRTQAEWNEKKKSLNGACGKPFDVLMFLMNEVRKRNGEMVLSYGELIHIHREKSLTTPTGKYFDNDIDTFVNQAGFQVVINLEPILWKRFGWSLRMVYTLKNPHHVSFAQIYNPCFHQLKAFGKTGGKVPGMEMYVVEPQPDGKRVKEIWSDYYFPKSWIYPSKLSPPITTFGYDEPMQLWIPAESEKVLTCLYGDWSVPRKGNSVESHKKGVEKGLCGD